MNSKKILKKNNKNYAFGMNEYVEGVLKYFNLQILQKKTYNKQESYYFVCYMLKLNKKCNNGLKKLTLDIYLLDILL